jgi:hypothetical protein
MPPKQAQQQRRKFGPALHLCACCKYSVHSAIARTARARPRPLAHPHSQTWAAMLQRRLQTAARLMAEGQGAALWQGFTRQQQWQGAAAAAGHPAAACSSSGGGGWGSSSGPLLLHTRWHSELTQRKPSEEQEDLVYDGPFGNAVKRVKASLPGAAAARLPPCFPLPLLSPGARLHKPAPAPTKPSSASLSAGPSAHPHARPPSLPPACRSCLCSAARALCLLGPSSWALMPPPP